VRFAPCRFTVTATRKASYSGRAALVSYQALLASLGTAQPGGTETLRLSASLDWSGDRPLPTGDTRTEAWTSTILDPIADAALLTSDAGVTTTLIAPNVTFPVAAGKQAKCAFVYSTLELDVPYTITAWLGWDADGASTWQFKMTGSYGTAGYTNMDTVVQMVDAASGQALAGQLAGVAQSPEPGCQPGCWQQQSPGMADEPNS
jgi:hypothetical protein